LCAGMIDRRYHFSTNRVFLKFIDSIGSPKMHRRVRVAPRVEEEPEPKPEEPTISRPRRIYWDKKLIILHPNDISSLEHLQYKMESVGVERFVNGTDTIDETSLLYLQSCEMPINPFVPIPDVEVKDLGEIHSRPQVFKRSKSYLKFDVSKSPGATLDYDMDVNDEKWLKKYNRGKTPILREILFEYIYAVVDYECIHNVNPR
jgi:hypothetical protein